MNLIQFWILYLSLQNNFLLLIIFYSKENASRRHCLEPIEQRAMLLQNYVSILANTFYVLWLEKQQFFQEQSLKNSAAMNTTLLASATERPAHWPTVNMRPCERRMVGIFLIFILAEKILNYPFGPPSSYGPYKKRPLGWNPLLYLEGKIA